MSTLGVPYSPMVPNFTMWHLGAYLCMAKRMLLVPRMLFIIVSLQCSRSIML